MNDLEFMIVNSNLPHSQAVLHELENRVTFNVYQDTVEKNIWGLMEGGKDDIYVYDRCGRLAYYIPYPLSIMNSDEALVVSAILATYYRSPCGVTCDKQNNSSLEDILNAKETTEGDFFATTSSYSEEPAYGTEILIPTDQPEENNFTPSNETDINKNDESLASNDLLNKINDFDYPFYNDTMDDLEYNESSIVFKDDLYNSLQSVLFNNNTLSVQIEDLNLTLSNTNSTDELPTNSTYEDSSKSNDTQNHDLHHDHKPTVYAKPSFQPPKRKSDRCIEADISVCKNWSKKRLIRAHNCCSISEERRDLEMCRNFGKKRCKKLRTILKCCIKTAFIETPTTSVNETESIQENTTSTMSDKIEEAAVATASYDVVCCRDHPDGKLCRVIESPPCGEGEYIAENVDLSEVRDSNPSK
ncbi:uncharacterized protein LOC129958634 [Argiope bruennichi]|uniref:uncharacterized protein LOC129958634 n=1 Tax=Argiope bruennichi TaxID=94029 RepID=UPI0024948365|nr:uncharacterized protein LOC129958634 [Argiope bruennichi]XP_055927220.1 uncharacterized protein LOC129958634 [Argiope bruennichi]